MASGMIKKSEIRKKTYTFNDTDTQAGCFVLDLKTYNTVVIGIRATDRVGWNFITRHGASGSSYPSYWVISNLSQEPLSGTYTFDVLYVEI